MPLLRRARPDDLDDLTLVEATAWQTTYADILPAPYLHALTPSALAPRWHHRLHRTGETIWVTQVGARVVGYASLGASRDPDLDDGFAGELYELYVHPRLQGRGLGRDLLAHAWTVLAAQGHRWGTLWVLEANRRTRFIYERAGLLPDGQRRILRVGGAAIPALRYALPLNPLDLSSLLPQAQGR